jgi:hypothetical protein
MAGLAPAIHVLAAPQQTWMRGTSPRMTFALEGSRKSMNLHDLYGGLRNAQMRVIFEHL